MVGLSDEQAAIYRRDGVMHPVPVMTSGAAMDLRRRVEALEVLHGGGAGGYSLAQFFRVNGHLVIPLLAEIAQTSGLLDAVESLLGPEALALYDEVLAAQSVVLAAGAEGNVALYEGAKP